MMDRIPSILSLSHHPLSLQSQNLSTSTNSSSASLNQQALNSLNFHQQSNHSHNQLNQNLNHSLISSSNHFSQHHHQHHSQQQQMQQQQQSTNLHHHQQLNGLLNNVGANGCVRFAMTLAWISFLKQLFSNSSTIFSLLTSSSLMKKPHDDHIKRPMNAFMVNIFKLLQVSFSSHVVLWLSRFGVVCNEGKSHKIIQKCVSSLCYHPRTTN